MMGIAKDGYIASFVAMGPGKAGFIGLYKINDVREMTYEQYLANPFIAKLMALGMQPLQDRPTIRWFDLHETEHYKDWKGKLIVNWPPPEISWWRRAHQNTIAIHALHEESALDEEIKDWREVDLKWDELALLGPRWRSKLSEWRAIYFIFDESDCKGYVGSAYGAENLLSRWRNYSVSGHGGNKMLLGRDPKNFRFSILERVSPDMEAAEVIRLEGTWKERLHTRAPYGLNEN